MLPTIIIILCILLFFAVPLALTMFFMRRFTRRYDMDKYSFSLRPSDMTDGFSPRLVSFKSGKNTLRGYVFGESNDGGLVVFCHGLFGGAAEYFAFARHFVSKGQAVFMFDNTGCNESEGKSIQGAMQGLYDLQAAFEYLNAHEPQLIQRNIALIGHSWGGFAAAAFPVKGFNIKCVVSLAGYDRAPLAMCNFVTGMFGRSTALLLPYFNIIQWLQYGKKGFISSVANINSSDIPYLIVQGSRDKIIHHNSAAIYNFRHRITNPNANFIFRTESDHNKHNTIFRDSSATAYMESRYSLMRDARSTLSGNQLESALSKIYNETNRFMINSLDDKIMQRIDELIEKSV